MGTIAAKLAERRQKYVGDYWKTVRAAAVGEPDIEALESAARAAGKTPDEVEVDIERAKERAAAMAVVAGYKSTNEERVKLTARRAKHDQERLAAERKFDEREFVLSEEFRALNARDKEVATAIQFLTCTPLDPEVSVARAKLSDQVSELTGSRLQVAADLEAAQKGVKDGEELVALDKSVLVGQGYTPDRVTEALLNDQRRVRLLTPRLAEIDAGLAKLQANLDGINKALLEAI